MRFALLIVLVGLSAVVAEDRYVFASRDQVPLSWSVHPHHLTNSDGPHQSESITFRIILKRQNLAELEKKFWETNDPNSPLYGQYLSKEQVDQLVAPSEDSKAKVAGWLAQFDARVEPFSDFFQVTCRVRTAEKIFQTGIIPFRQNSRVVYRIFGAASIPRALQADIELISGISELFSDKTKYSSYKNLNDAVKLSKLAKKGTTAPLTKARDDIITPSTIRSFYHIPANQQSNSNQNSQGIAAFDDYYSAGALTKFCADADYAVPNVTRQGPICFPTKCDQFESDLDVQYITAIGRNTNTMFINHANGNWILGWTQELSAMSNPPLVHSVSYGWSELDQCSLTTKCATLGYDSRQYVTATNVEFQKLGSRGLSIFVSDGDDGAASLGGATGNCPLDPDTYCILGGCPHTSTQCIGMTITAGSTSCFWPMGVGSAGCAALLNDTGVTAIDAFFQQNFNCNPTVELDIRNNTFFYSSCDCASLSSTTTGSYTISGYQFDPQNGALFVADYPTSSPYVTSVGATQLVNTASGYKEIGCSIKNKAIITTGGGFSSFQTAAKYQYQAVSDWLSSGSNIPPAYSFNTSMRGYPDITLVGHNYKVFFSTNDRSPDQCPCDSTPVDGTSASSPAIAGFFTLINDELLQNGAAPLGFVNPLLYSIYSSSSYNSIFNDITEGDNTCTRSFCCAYGYYASKGWDPVSGLGSINWPALSNYVLKLKLNKPALQKVSIN